MSASGKMAARSPTRRSVFAQPTVKDLQNLRVDAAPQGPAGALALVECGRQLATMNEASEAASCFQAALERDPHCIAALLALAEMLSVLGQPNAAADCYFSALRQEPGHVVARVNLAVLLRQAGLHEDAIRLIEPVVEACDATPTVRFNLANALADVGRFEEARRHYLHAFRIHPQPAKVFYNYAQITRFGEHERALVETCTDLTAGAAHDVLQQTCWQFGLGKARDDLADYDQAWAHFEAANRLVDARFDAARHAEGISRICDVFSRDVLRVRRAWGDPEVAPVFIVGMPRSGTSLVEQILAGHSRVHAAGEREELGRLVAEWAQSQGRSPDDPLAGREFCPEGALVMARRYREAIPERAGAAFSTDKMPANFLLLGWIATCFPKARVIHCRRDPRDTILSCYFQNFTASQPFAYALEDLIAYYRGYERLMAHWRNALRQPMLEVEYERLVVEPELESRRMVEFCGLDWEPACLSSHTRERAVTTASQWQVRQPVYRTSRGRWRNYARFLGRLRDEFGDGDRAE